jgi:GrpB-like predicted nucleotidyltransferase (UPF0157 family)
LPRSVLPFKWVHSLPLSEPSSRLSPARIITGVDGKTVCCEQVPRHAYRVTMDPDPKPTDAVTFDGTRWSNATADVVHLVDPSPAWAAQYAAEVQAIRQRLGAAADEICFEHIGSTAVPGLAAKPIIDLLLIPHQGCWPREILERELPSLGYVFWAENPDAQHLFFVKGMPPFGSGRTHHVHVRPMERAKPILMFRNYLRDHATTADEYAALKRDLAERYPDDRDAYTRGKDDFIAAVLQRSHARDLPDE